MPSEEVAAAVERVQQDPLAEVQAKLDVVRKEKKALKRVIARQETEIQDLHEHLDLVSGLHDLVPDPPPWLAPEPRGKYHGTPVFVLSDTHFDEVVKPEEIDFLNAYDRDIATSRLRRAFEGAINLPRHWLGSNLTYDGIVLACAGDLITGEIHDELKETNIAKPPETIEFFLDPTIAGIRMLREEYGKVHIVEVDGNHDRLYKKKRAKGSARDSWSWIFWKVVEREFKRYKTVTFQIPDSRNVIFQVYDTRILLHHGDQFRGGSGIAGALTPMHIGDFRKRKKAASARMYGSNALDYDIQLLGHFHHRNSFPGTITVGTLKGYDEYSNLNNYPFEPPSQELLIMTPERGITFQAPIWVQEREEEGW